MRCFHHFLYLLLLLTFPSTSPAPIINLLSRWYDGTVQNYLQQLSNWYQHCHIQTVLYELDAPISNIENPHVLTLAVPPVVHPTRFKRQGDGGRSLPSFRHMTAFCQATFQLLLTLEELPHESNTRYRIQAREGKLAGYRFEQRHSILLIHAENKVQEDIKLRDRTIQYGFGRSVYFVLEYGTHHKSELRASLSCYACRKPQHSIGNCPSIEACLRVLEHTHREMMDGGVNIKWVMPKIGTDGQNSCQKQCYFCLRPVQTPSSNQVCTPVLKDAMVNYVAGPLNVTHPSYSEALGLKPWVSWSDDTNLAEKEALRFNFPLHFYPMLNPNNSKNSLKFITSDGVHFAIPSLHVYIQPLDLACWFGAAGLLLTLIMLMTLAVKVEEAGDWNLKANLTWNSFWAISALLDQIECPYSTKVGRSGWLFVPNALFCISVGLVFVLNNGYRAMLNVNTVAGNELIASWERLNQLEDFTALYVPIGHCAWQRFQHLSQPGEHLKAITWAGASPCTADCKRAVDEAFCIFKDKYWNLIVSEPSDPCAGILRRIHKSELGRRLEDCKDEAVHSLVKQNRMLKYFPEAELSSYVRHQMLKPKTAMLVTAEAMPDVWNEFKKAMAQDRSLKFSHNFFTEDNSWVVNRGSRLVVACGIPRAQNVVAQRVHNLLASGTWDFWISLDKWTKEISRERNKLRPRTVPQFQPLTLSHDSMFMLALITGSLIAASMLCFLADVATFRMLKLSFSFASLEIMCRTVVAVSFSRQTVVSRLN